MWNKWFGNYNMRHDCDRNCSFDGSIEASTDQTTDQHRFNFMTIRLLWAHETSVQDLPYKQSKIGTFICNIVYKYRCIPYFFFF